MTETKLRKCIKENQDKLDWSWMSINQKLSEDFIREFQDRVMWLKISRCQTLSEDFIREFQDKVDWEQISRCQTLSEDFIREFQDRVMWLNISIHQTLSENFIREFKDKLDWSWISINQKLSKDFIKEFQNKIDWCALSIHQTLSEDYIMEFQDKLDWKEISRNQKLSEDFIREFQDKVNWYMISMYQTLSEDFIREFQDKVNWYMISMYQTLSEDFIREFQDKVNWCMISRNQKLSEDFIREFQDKPEFERIKYMKSVENKIFLLFGRSGSGKDSIKNEIIKKFCLPLLDLTVFTTRNKRSGENDGKDYNFITNERFFEKVKNDEFLEYSSYTVFVDGSETEWYYGTLKVPLSELKKTSFITIRTFAQLKEFIHYYGDLCIPIYLDISPLLSLKHMIKRELKNKKPNFKEVFRRFISDNSDYRNITKQLPKNTIICKIKNNVSIEKGSDYIMDKMIDIIKNTFYEEI